MSYDEPVLNHVGQAVAVLDRSIAFYTDLLGFAVERRLQVPDAGTAPLLGLAPPLGLDVAYLRLGTFVLELMQFRDSDNPAWRERVFNEPGLDAPLHLRRRPCRDAQPRRGARRPDRDARLPVAAMIRDPDGQLWSS